MDATTFAARLGPLAAMLGVGTAIAMSGSGIAFAEPSVNDSASSERGTAQPDDSATASGTAVDDVGTSHRNRTDARDGTDQASATRPDGRQPETADDVSAEVTPDAAEEPEESDDVTAEDAPPAANEVPANTGVTVMIDPAEGEEAAEADLTTDAVARSDTATASDSVGRFSAQPSARAVGVQPAPPQAANPVADFFSGIAALFNNQTPALDPTQNSQAANGVVTGMLNAADPDSHIQTYTVTRNPIRGTVVINPDGSYLYSPDRVFAQSGTTDSFEVTVSDEESGFHIHGFLGWINLLSFGLFGNSRHTSTTTVSVVVAPFSLPNAAPTGTAVVGSPDAVTGVVTGTVVGHDADGDALTYRGSATTSKGTVVVSPAGAFTYTPTPAARENAAAPTATAADRADTFHVTIDDGHGATATVPVTVVIGSAATAPLAAFPGAEGFGSHATGGRGGEVVYVTNTNASGVGSLQWAIDQPGAKYILFKVSGLIDTQIHLTNGDVTIAGHTSPGGITIRGFVTDETPYQDQNVRRPTDFAENWILQHVRIRPGTDGRSDDGLRLRYTRNAIVDHVSIGNATDEAVEISYSNNITIQNSIIAETLGGHSFYGGVLMNYSNPAHGFGLDNVSLHHNIFNRIEGRLPEGSRESVAAAGSTMNLELSNNLYWDPRFFVALAVDTNVVRDAAGNPYPIYWNINAVNNFFRTGAQFPYGMFDDQILRVPGNRLYVSGNRMSLYPTRSDYELFYCCNDYDSVTDPDDSAGRAQQLASRHAFPDITYTPTDMLRTVLLNRAGAWPRDPMDRRLLQFVAQDTISSASPNINPANDALLPPYSGISPAAPVDTDGDGMPDAWEIARGLNPDVANHNAGQLSTRGYTDLEVYLHELSASRMA